ncbi:hypothetical protein PsorP6_007933 [Peronosclerospora sorghi]|uniref:Uncharacterized protein n=1 Tax=Peronosclerospora sorghi TaxID=230839 RepID=A0ACC0WAF9_9STRA|nr:hypothetical protein PsorP6_007933 [Peronosclerospora sorghi]
MSIALNVTSRALKPEEYDNAVGFHVHNVIDSDVTAIWGRFQVLVRAHIFRLERGDCADFWLLSDKETSCPNFILHMYGPIDAGGCQNMTAPGNSI